MPPTQRSRPGEGRNAHRLDLLRAELTPRLDDHEKRIASIERVREAVTKALILAVLSALLALVLGRGAPWPSPSASSRSESRPSP